MSCMYTTDSYFLKSHKPTGSLEGGGCAMAANNVLSERVTRYLNPTTYTEGPDGDLRQANHDTLDPECFLNLINVHIYTHSKER